MSLLICTMPRTGGTVFTDVLGCDPEMRYTLHEPENPKLHEVLFGGGVGSNFGWWVDFLNQEVYDVVRKYSTGSDVRFLHPFSAHGYSYVPGRYKLYIQELLLMDSVIKVNDGVRRLGWYLNILPKDSKAICLIRDPRAITASCISDNSDPFGFWFRESWEVLSESFRMYKSLSSLDVVSKVFIVCLFQYRTLVEFISREPGVFLVKYEDFCKKPIDVLENVYNHLGRPLPTEVLSRVLGGDSRYSSMWQGSPHSLTPSEHVSSENVERFREVPYDWCSILKRMSAYDVMESLGYVV